MRCDIYVWRGVGLIYFIINKKSKKIASVFKLPYVNGEGGGRGRGDNLLIL